LITKIFLFFLKKKIVYPKNDDHLESNLTTKNIHKLASIHESQNGDLNSLTFVHDWLKLFVQQLASFNDTTRRQHILISNSYLFLKLCSLAQKEPSTTLLDDINTLLVQHHISFLFHPAESTAEASLMTVPGLEAMFWQTMGDYSLRASVNSRLAFLQVFRQTMRLLLTNTTRSEMRDWFVRFGAVGGVEEQLGAMLMPISSTQQSSSGGGVSVVDNVAAALGEDVAMNDVAMGEDVTMCGGDGADLSQDNMTHSIVNTSQQVNVKLTEAEVNEYCEWVDDMSRIGMVLVTFWSHFLVFRI
jgi:hypothetical protein